LAGRRGAGILVFLVQRWFAANAIGPSTIAHNACLLPTPHMSFPLPVPAPSAPIPAETRP